MSCGLSVDVWCRICALRCIRPDKVVLAVQGFVAQVFQRTPLIASDGYTSRRCLI